jgi:AcrR family transcriptional regulator
LTEPAIAAAALVVIDRDGLAGLTMRAVAGELGMAPMSLYRYVESREQLEGLVLDGVLGGVDLEVSARVSWKKRVTLLVERVREAIGAHPELVPLLLTRRQSTEGALRWGEAMLHALDAGGFSGKDRAIAFRTLLSYVLGAVQVEHLGPLSGAGTAALAALPADSFPYLADTARHARTIPPDEEFHRGLQLVLRGLDP